MATYTVNQLAKLAGITVRTLHHYDEIELLKPSYQKENGYRVYEEKELIKLQQILFFRELEFSLDDIKQMMDAPNFNEKQALQDQKMLLTLRKERLGRLISAIDEAITAKGGERMSNDDSFSAFNDPTYQQHKDEVKARWGNTDAYRQSMERVGKMSKADLDQVKIEQGEITQKTADLMKEGFSASSPEVQEQVDRFYKHLRNFYEPSYELFRGLGQMYVDDLRFTKVYEDVAEGLAVFMRDAMQYYADQHEKVVSKD